MKQETVSGSGISWAICKSAPRSRQTTTPAPHHSVFYRPDALPAAQPTAWMHWRQMIKTMNDSDKSLPGGESIARLSVDRPFLVVPLRVHCATRAPLIAITTHNSTTATTIMGDQPDRNPETLGCASPNRQIKSKSNLSSTFPSYSRETASLVRIIIGSLRHRSDRL